MNTKWKLNKFTMNEDVYVIDKSATKESTINTKLRKPTKEELLNYERQIDLKWKLKDVLEYCTLPQLIEIKKIMEDKYKFIIYEDEY